MLIYIKRYISYVVSIQIQAHWVTSAYIGGKVNLYDSCIITKLTRCLMLQLKQNYQVAVNGGHLRVNEMPIQQQLNGIDCGLFSIAFAYHIALGDEPSALSFNSSEMHQHLIKCFEDITGLLFYNRSDNPLISCTKTDKKNLA